MGADVIEFGGLLKDGGTDASGGTASPGDPAGTQPHQDGDGAQSGGTAEAAGAEPGDSPAPDAAVPAEAAGLAELAAAAAGRAVAALAAGDTAAALSELDAVRGTAAQARRLVKAAASGRKPRTGQAMRPGQLRDRVKAHLDANPGATLTPYEIARVLGNSAGAVGNALDRLVGLGDAQLASDKPRRYIATAAS